MAQLDSSQQNGGTSKTVELMNSENPTMNTYATGKVRDHEGKDHLQQGKRFSVIAKVKEKAKKWRQSLARKKAGHNGHRTPSWGVALEDYEGEDEHESDGSSLDNESQRELRSFRESHRNHQKPINKSDSDNKARPRVQMRAAGPFLRKSLSENRTGKNPSLTGANINEDPRAKSLGSNLREKQESRSKFTIEALTAQQNDSISTEKDDHHTSTKPKSIVGENISSEEKEDPSSLKNSDEGWKTPEPGSPPNTASQDTVSHSATEEDEHQSATTKTTRIVSVSEATNTIISKIPGLSIKNLKATEEDRSWDKGSVSVKEYLKNKLEPGEDERALSQVITEVISPRKSPDEKSVVQKVRTAVSMLLQAEEPSSLKSSRSHSQNPVSTNAEEVQEEEPGRVLQAN